MRPTILFPLFAEITSIKGIGARIASLYKTLCGTRLVDLLWHIPVTVVDRSYAPPLRHAEPDHVITLIVTIAEHIPPKRRSLPYRIIATDGTDDLTITYFNVKGDYLSNIYPVGNQIAISGKLERYHTGWTMSHPDYVVPAPRINEIPKLEPIYPLTQGLSNKGVQKAVAEALKAAPPLPEWIDPAHRTRENWPSWRDALETLHRPLPTHTPDLYHQARKRLAYDELLADQLALVLIRRHHKTLSGRQFTNAGLLRQKLEATLPFTLTQGQHDAITSIIADMQSNNRMLRLLQGDVGSGKTIVALFAMLHAMESGAQAALMAPTEILAKQHHARLGAFLAPLNVPIALAIGKSKTKEKMNLLAGLKNGSTPLVVGTHALFQKDVFFKDLGLAIIDEQHRFGVEQRLTLSEKGKGVDILMMTATPIPRTLTLTAYGDMDISVLADKPAGRSPIDTRLIDVNRLSEVIDAVGRKIKTTAQAYWICPLVEESEKVDLAAATDRAKMLGEVLGEKNVGLVHGQMTADERDAAMTAFIDGKTKLLVATTVIEVGVDVPNASLMIVEHAERFGLAQLHQLRGRVGRGAEKSTCLLMYQSPLSETAKARLTMLRETEDGFKIAEEDLRLRGAGEILGTRQSGLHPFRLANLAEDQALLHTANKDTQYLIDQDPLLQSPRGQACRTLLYLFAKEESLNLPRA